MFEHVKRDWLSNIRGDVLAGIVVALALIPEAIAFSIIAGVDPKVGLYASFCIAVIIAFVGGRPGMISAATGAMALLMVTLVKDHGLEYLLAATLLTGVLQIIAGFLRLGGINALCFPIRCYRLCKCPRYSNFYGAITRTNECDLARLCDDSSGFRHNLFVPLSTNNR